MCGNQGARSKAFMSFVLAAFTIAFDYIFFVLHRIFDGRDFFVYESLSWKLEASVGKKSSNNENKHAEKTSTETSSILSIPAHLNERMVF
jgi:hypothetical protein